MNANLKATFTRINNITTNDLKGMTFEEVNAIKTLSDKLNDLYKGHIKALYEECGAMEQASSIEGKVWRLNRTADSKPTEGIKAWSAMTDEQKAVARQYDMTKTTNGKTGVVKLVLVKSK